MSSSFLEIFMYKNWYNGWHLHLHKTHDLQIWLAGISIGVESLATDKISTSNVFTFKRRDFEKMLLLP